MRRLYSARYRFTPEMNDLDASQPPALPHPPLRLLERPPRAPRTPPPLPLLERLVRLANRWRAGG